MTDYSKSCIYKIASKDASIEDIYIGSTCNFVKRRWGHKNVCNNTNHKTHNRYMYRFIRETGGWENWDIYMIEQFSCNTKIQKEQVERGWVESLKPTLNRCIPANYHTGDVYSKSEYGKGYRGENKEAIKEKTKEYDQKTVHCKYCNHDINLHGRSRHNRSNKHITNSSESSEEEQDTIMNEMSKLRDDNELKLQEIQNTCYEIDKLIN